MYWYWYPTWSCMIILICTYVCVCVCVYARMYAWASGWYVDVHVHRARWLLTEAHCGRLCLILAAFVLFCFALLSDYPDSWVTACADGWPRLHVHISQAAYWSIRRDGPVTPLAECEVLQLS